MDEQANIRTGKQTDRQADNKTNRRTGEKTNIRIGKPITCMVVYMSIPAVGKLWPAEHHFVARHNISKYAILFRYLNHNSFKG